MLLHLSIQNYALIEKIEIDFPKGLTIITGETGAGKSIVMEALSLVLGERADSSVLFDKQKKCVVEAEFSLDRLQLKNFFSENDLDFEKILTLRREIVDAVKDQLDNILESWGYHLIDLQINDITFDEEVIRSMAKVVASNNLKAAAENEGQALLITKTKAAEAEGNAIKIAAEAERLAAQLRGQGVALFREEVAKGMSQAATEMKQANLDTNVILFSMWVEAIKNFAEYGKGNVIFLDGGSDGMEKTGR